MAYGIEGKTGTINTESVKSAPLRLAKEHFKFLFISIPAITADTQLSTNGGKIPENTFLLLEFPNRYSTICPKKGKEVRV